jgi:hypothetical protein
VPAEAEQLAVIAVIDRLERGRAMGSEQRHEASIGGEAKRSSG